MHPAPDLYCPTAHAGVEEGVTGGRVWDRVAAREREGANVAASSRWRGWDGVVDRVADALADLVGERVPAADRVDVRVFADDFVDVPVDLGDLLGDTGTHAPQVDGV